MNIDLLNMYSKIVELLGESAEQYNDEAVIWTVGFDEEFFTRIILSCSNDKIKLMTENTRYVDSYIDIENHNVIHTIIGYGFLNGIQVSDVY